MRALTRGDGAVGEDVRTNVATIRTVPLKLLPGAPATRNPGRGLFPLGWVQRAQRVAQESGEQEFANPRNTAAGTLKLQDSRLVADRPLDCMLYNVDGGAMQALGVTRRTSCWAHRDWGFKPPQGRSLEVTTSVDGIMAFVAHWDKARHDLNFAIDGIVIKVNRYDHQKRLGNTAKSPRWALAYKFETERARTELVDVKYQVGRTGAVTPVADLDPVQLGGTTVQHASLHNADQIAKLDLRMATWSSWRKGGDHPQDCGGGPETAHAEGLFAPPSLVFPSGCPECGSTLERVEGEAQHYCVNSRIVQPRCAAASNTSFRGRP